MARLLLAWSAIASLAPLLGLVVSASLSVGNGRAGAGLCGEPRGQARERAFQRHYVLLGQVVPDQAQVQVPPPFGRRPARLIFAATMAGSHGWIRPAASSRPRHDRTVRSDSPV